MRQQVTVRVSASTSNLGPGFDFLGPGLRLFNTITPTRAKDRPRQEKIVTQAADLFFRRARRSRFHFSCSARERVPRSRGLGSSATIRLGGFHGFDAVG